MTAQVTELQIKQFPEVCPKGNPSPLGSVDLRWLEILPKDLATASSSKTTRNPKLSFVNKFRVNCTGRNRWFKGSRRNLNDLEGKKRREDAHSVRSQVLTAFWEQRTQRGSRIQVGPGWHWQLPGAGSALHGKPRASGLTKGSLESFSPNLHGLGASPGGLPCHHTGAFAHLLGSIFHWLTGPCEKKREQGRIKMQDRVQVLIQPGAIGPLAWQGLSRAGEQEICSRALLGCMSSRRRPRPPFPCALLGVETASVFLGPGSLSFLYSGRASAGYSLLFPAGYC